MDVQATVLYVLLLAPNFEYGTVFGSFEFLEPPPPILNQG